MAKDYYPFDPTAFRMAPGGACPYLHRNFVASLGLLEDAYRGGETCAVLSGPPGVGKTILAEQLISRFRAAGVVAPPVITGQVAGDDLLRLVAFAFGVEQPTDKARLYEALARRMQREHRRGKPVLLCIDEAQNLYDSALEELRLLSQLRRDSLPLLQILLVGQPGLLATLQSSTLEHFRQRIGVIHRLEPLSSADTRGYVGHRLAVIGWRGDPSFGADALGLLHEFSAGVPAWINLAVSRMLWRGDSERVGCIDGAFTQVVLAEMEQDGLCPGAPDADPLGLFHSAEPAESLEPLGPEAAKSIAQSLDPKRCRMAQSTQERRWRIARLRMFPVRGLAGVPRRLLRPVFLGVLAAVTVAVWLFPYLSPSSLPPHASTKGAVEPHLDTAASDSAFAEGAEPAFEREPPAAPAADMPIAAEGNSIVAVPEEDVVSEPAVAVVPEELLSETAAFELTLTPAADAGALTAAQVSDIYPLPDDEGPPREAPVRSGVASEPVPGLSNLPAEPSVTTESSTSVPELLAAADTALRENRLTLPPGDSAFAYFSAVLEAEPGNAEAVAGMQRLTERYGDLAAKAMEAGELEEAERFLARGLRVDPKDAVLREMRDELAILAAANRPTPAPVVAPPGELLESPASQTPSDSWREPPQPQHPFDL